MQTTDALYVPLILGITQAIKATGLNPRFSPVIAIVAGIIISALTNGYGLPSIMTGIMWGLSSAGLWSSTKSLVLSK